MDETERVRLLAVLERLRDRLRGKMVPAPEDLDVVCAICVRLVAETADLERLAGQLDELTNGTDREIRAARERIRALEAKP